MLLAHQETAVARFYREKVKSRPPMLAQVAAARKLSGEVWRILTYQVPYREEDTDLTGRKELRMRKIADEPTPEVSTQALDSLADRLSTKNDVLDRLQEEAGETDQEVNDDI